MAESIEKFQARSVDGDVTFEVHKHQRYAAPWQRAISRRSLQQGPIQYVLSDGRDLKVLDADAETLEIVDTGQVIRKI